MEIAKHLTLAGVVAVSKFVKTKHLSNSRDYGFKTLFFIDWDKRFGVYACITFKILYPVSQLYQIIGFLSA